MIGRPGVVVLALVAAGALLATVPGLFDGRPRDARRQPVAPRDTAMVALPTERPSPPAPRSEQPLAPDGSGPVRHRSARIEDIDEARKPRPSRLRIARLGVDAPVAALGVARSGEMDVPTDADTVAWYEYGPSPGQRGSAVLAAHVDYNGREGVFFRLADLRSGDRVEVAFAMDRTRTFVVQRRASVAKRALAVDKLFRRTGGATLTLITCGGDFDAATRSYRNNVIVRAVPLDAGG